MKKKSKKTRHRLICRRLCHHHLQHRHLRHHQLRHLRHHQHRHPPNPSLISTLPSVRVRFFGSVFSALNVNRDASVFTALWRANGPTTSLARGAASIRFVTRALVPSKITTMSPRRCAKPMTHPHPPPPNLERVVDGIIARCASSPVDKTTSRNLAASLLATTGYAPKAVDFTTDSNPP